MIKTKISKKFFIVSFLIMCSTIFLFTYNYFQAETPESVTRKIVEEANELTPDENGVYNVDMTELLKPENANKKLVLRGYENPNPTFSAESGWDVFPSGKSHKATYTFSNLKVDRYTNSITYDIGCYYVVRFPGATGSLTFYSDDFYVNDGITNQFIGQYSSNNGPLYANGQYEQILYRTERHTARFYGNVLYTCEFQDTRDGVTLGTASIQVRFNNLNNQPTVTGKNQVINEGDVASGLFTQNSLYTGELGSGTSGNNGFMYYDPDTNPTGSNKFGSSDVAKNATISLIKNSAGSIVNFQDMNNSDTYTITSSTVDEYGMSASATRTVRVNAKPKIKSANSNWIAGDPKATIESLLTDTRNGSASLNKVGMNGFLVFDKEEYDTWQNPYTISNSTSIKTSVTKIRNINTNQVVDFATMNKTPGTYEISAQAYDNGNGSGRALYSDIATRTITLSGYSITTNVSNGTITDSSKDLLMGSSHKISFSPNAGYVLDSIIVDGVKLDINSFKDSDGYSFSNLDASHTISVKYRKASAIKLIINKIIVNDKDQIINPKNLGIYGKNIEDATSTLIMSSSKNPYKISLRADKPSQIKGFQAGTYSIKDFSTYDFKFVSLEATTTEQGLSISNNNNSYSFNILTDSRIERTIKITVKEKINNEVMGDKDREENYIKLN